MRDIYYNGTIITMEAANSDEISNYQPEAVLVKNGIIEYVGSLDEAVSKAGKHAKLVDIKGQCLMPGFIDSHSHYIMNAKMSACADLLGCNSFDDIVTTLKDYINHNKIKNPYGVIGYGYDHNFLIEKSHPDKNVLDRVSMDIPIFILHISAHIACANSKALNLAGYDANTVEPEGGHIGRVGGTMEPSGYLEEAAMMGVQQCIKVKAAKSVASIFRNINKDYICNGITTVQDGATSAQDFSFLRLLSALGLLKVDVVAYPIMTGEGVNLVHKYGDKYKDYNRKVRIGGYKLVLDGSPQGRTAWLSKSYEGSEDYSGYPWLEDDKVNEFVKIAVKEKRQLLAHCNGDAASEQFITAYENVIRDICSEDNLRPVMIHCQTVRNDQLDRMSVLKMIASIFVGHVWYWGDVHVGNLGSERGNRISPVADALKRNVVVTFHQDTPVTKPNILHSIWCAVNRKSRDGNQIGPEQKVSVYEAMKAVTVNAAYQYFEEDKKGTITKGKRADLVILDKSPLDIEPEKIKDIKVVQTIKEGITVYSAL